MEELGLGLQPYIDDTDAKHPNFKTKIITEQIIDKLNIKKTDKILDVGCGNGRFAKVFIDKGAYEITGLDLNRKPNINICPINFTYIQDTIFTNILNKEKFDIIWFMGSFYLHYELGYYNTIKRAKHLLSDTGKIILVDEVRRDCNEIETAGYYNIDNLAKLNNLQVSINFIQENKTHFIKGLSK